MTLRSANHQYTVGFVSALLMMAALGIGLQLAKQVASAPDPLSGLITWFTTPLFTPLQIVWLVSISAVVYLAIVYAPR